MARIVVGVDGSAASADALRFALGEARLRGAELCVLHAWSIPVTLMPPAGMVTLPPVRALEAEASALLDGLLDKVGDEAGGVTIVRRVAENGAVPALLHEAEGADLLVVGSRGMGGFRGLLLGSVSQQCAQHAPCPVVIVRHRDDRGGS